MTCGVVYKNIDGNFVSCIDSGVSQGNFSNVHQKDMKYHIFGKPYENNGILLFSGQVSIFQKIVRLLNNDNYPVKQSIKYPVDKEDLYGFIEAISKITTNEERQGNFEMLVVYASNCYYIDEALAIIAVDDYYSIGSGSVLAFGALAMADNKNKKDEVIKKRVLKALRVVNKFMPNIRPPYVLLEFINKKVLIDPYDENPEETEVNKVLVSYYEK